MSDMTKPDTPRWILIATGLVGLVAAVLAAAAKYYEFHKARVEATRVQASAAERPNPSSDLKGEIAQQNNDKSKKGAGMESAPVTSVVGQWNNMSSKGWTMEFLATRETVNRNPTGAVEARGVWTDEGDGKISARMGPMSEWEWKAVVQGNTMTVDVLLNGKHHSTQTFSRH